MNNHLYKCHYCGVEYLPKRRNKQKYCSNSCRVNAFNVRKNAKTKPSSNLETVSRNKPTEVEKISMAGIGNTAIANVITHFGKAVLLSDENKPATKNDLDQMLIKLNQRFVPVRNAPSLNNGTYAFYNRKTETVVYLKTQKNGI